MRTIWRAAIIEKCSEAPMPKPTVAVTDVIDASIERAIGGGLNSFNDAATGVSDRRPLAVIVKDPVTGEVAGGALGRTSLGLLFLDLFFLPEALRGSGLGTEVLRMFEEEGRRRGCRSAVLYTISFQAPGFYERNGWRRFGEIPCDPPGTSRIFMTKQL
jgi:GNAT superfamily N-acetyltransferase